MTDEHRDINAAVERLRRRVKYYPADKPVIHCASPQVAVELIVHLCNFRYAHQSMYRLYQQRRFHRGLDISFNDYLDDAGTPALKDVWEFMPSSIKRYVKVTNGKLAPHLQLEAQRNEMQVQRSMADRSQQTHHTHRRPRDISPSDDEIRLVKNAEMLLERSYGVDRGTTTVRNIGRVPASVGYALQHKVFGQWSEFADLHFCNTVDREDWVRRLGMAWLFKQLSIVVDPPEELHTDDQRRLHNTSGFAARWSDGTGLTAINGVYVEEWKILNPDAIAPENVLKETNVEVRRVLIERLGYERLIEGAQAYKVGEDKFGRLWNLPGHEPIRVVEVKNSTPEPDGTYKKYFLRVPTNILTPKAAVAWTFSMGVNDYQPEVET